MFVGEDVAAPIDHHAGGHRSLTRFVRIVVVFLKKTFKGRAAKRSVGALRCSRATHTDAHDRRAYLSRDLCEGASDLTGFGHFGGSRGRQAWGSYWLRHAGSAGL